MKYPASPLDKPGTNLAAPESVSLSDIRPCIVQVDVPVQGLESILDGSISVLSTEVCSILGSIETAHRFILKPANAAAMGL